LPGFAIGTFTLRPTLDQRIIRESVRFGNSKTSRTYSQTSLSGTVQSDWSRHQLSIDGTGTWQKNISGTGTESPSADINARLDLDLVNDITARLGAGYSYSQESRTDPNAISGAVRPVRHSRVAGQHRPSEDTSGFCAEPPDWKSPAGCTEAPRWPVAPGFRPMTAIRSGPT
jgi:hypothetical protein